MGRLVDFIYIEPLFETVFTDDSVYLKPSRNLKKTRLVENLDIVINVPSLIQSIDKLPKIKPEETSSYYIEYKSLMKKALKIKEDFENMVNVELSNVDGVYYPYISKQLGSHFGGKLQGKFEKFLIESSNKIVNEILPNSEVIDIIDKLSIKPLENKISICDVIIEVDPKSIQEEPEYGTIYEIFLNIMNSKDEFSLDPLRAMWPDLYKCTFYVHEQNLKKKRITTKNKDKRLQLAEKYLTKKSSKKESLDAFIKKMLTEKEVDGINTAELFVGKSRSTLYRLYDEVHK